MSEPRSAKEKATPPRKPAPPPYEPAFGDPSFWAVLLSHVMGGSIRQLASAEKMIRAQVECRTPAPQPDSEKIRLLLIRAVMEMSYMHCAEVLSLVRSSEGESIIEEGMKLLGLKDLSEEELARVRASEQASPTPEQCPKCGSDDRRFVQSACVPRNDSWHSSAATQKGTK